MGPLAGTDEYVTRLPLRGKAGEHPAMSHAFPARTQPQ